jgi:hypothetical protein
VYLHVESPLLSGEAFRNSAVLSISTASYASNVTLWQRLAVLIRGGVEQMASEARVHMVIVKQNLHT